MMSIFALGVGLLMAADIPVTEVTIHPVAQETEIVIQLDGDPDYRDFLMEGPHRLVVDFMGARHALPSDNFMDINRGGVRAVRTSQYSSDIVRVVVELERKVSYRIEEEQGRLRLRLENPMGAFEPWSTGSAMASRASGSAASTSPAPSSASSSVTAAPRPEARGAGPRAGAGISSGPESFSSRASESRCPSPRHPSRTFSSPSPSSPGAPSFPEPP